MSIHAIEMRLPIREEGLFRHPPARLLLAKVQVHGRVQAPVVSSGRRDERGTAWEAWEE